MMVAFTVFRGTSNGFGNSFVHFVLEEEQSQNLDKKMSISLLEAERVISCWRAEPNRCDSRKRAVVYLWCTWVKFCNCWIGTNSAQVLHSAAAFVSDTKPCSRHLINLLVRLNYNSDRIQLSSWGVRVILKDTTVAEWPCWDLKSISLKISNLWATTFLRDLPFL